jgi:hypothetical protein
MEEYSHLYFSTLITKIFRGNVKLCEWVFSDIPKFNLKCYLNGSN